MVRSDHLLVSGHRRHRRRRRLEIVVGTGCGLAGQGHYVSAWNYVPGVGTYQDAGAEVPLADGGATFINSPALADLNLDGHLDVVAIADLGDGGSGSEVYAWDGQTGQSCGRR